nr:hypothetical protein [Tanacetum cinerariifolium]
ARKQADDVGRRARVRLRIRVGPADECLAAFERVQRQPAAVVGAGAWEGEEGRRDEAPGCLAVGLKMDMYRVRGGRTVSPTETVS